MGVNEPFARGRGAAYTGGASAGAPTARRDRMSQTTIDIPRIIQHVRTHEKRFGVFRGLTDKELREVLDVAVLVERPREKVLFRKGQPGREMYILLKGRVDIVDHYKGRSKVINQLGEGEAFGEVAIFSDHTRTATAMTNGSVLMLVLNEDNLLKVAAGPGGAVFIMNLLRVMSERLETMTHKYMKAKYGEQGPDAPVRRWLD